MEMPCLLIKNQGSVQDSHTYCEQILQWGRNILYTLILVNIGPLLDKLHILKHFARQNVCKYVEGKLILIISLACLLFHIKIIDS